MRLDLVPIPGNVSVVLISEHNYHLWRWQSSSLFHLGNNRGAAGELTSPRIAQGPLLTKPTCPNKLPVRT